MKLISLALIASVAVAGFAYAQTATPAPAAAPPAASSSSSGNISHDCKEEYKKLCGRHAGSEKQDCIKSNLDLGKFSDKCKTEFQQAAAKPKS